MKTGRVRHGVPAGEALPGSGIGMGGLGDMGWGMLEKRHDDGAHRRDHFVLRMLGNRHPDVGVVLMAQADFTTGQPGIHAEKNHAHRRHLE